MSQPLTPDQMRDALAAAFRLDSARKEAEAKRRSENRAAYLKSLFWNVFGISRKLLIVLLCVYAFFCTMVIWSDSSRRAERIKDLNEENKWEKFRDQAIADRQWEITELRRKVAELQRPR